MGYCEGGDLFTRLKAYGNTLLPETQVVEWFVQIALGVQYLHDHNILHRDLKVRVQLCLWNVAVATAVLLDTEHLFEQK